MYIQVPAKQVCVETTAGTAVQMDANVRPVCYSTSVTTLAATSFVSVLHT